MMEINTHFTGTVLHLKIILNQVKLHGSIHNTFARDKNRNL